jgi:transposase
MWFSIIVRLMQRFRQTGNATDRPRAGKPRKTTPREDRLISRRAQQWPFSTAGALRGNLALGGNINPEVVYQPSMAKTTVMYANSLPPFWYG